jgi:DNA-binding winged helix-turn-helix (wHTH) protein/TolB-like protein
VDTPVFADTIQFGNFRLDRRGHRLLRRDGSGVFAPVPVGSRALELLCVLVDHAGDVVTKQTIMDAVWPGTAVEESNLTVQLSTLRRILDAGRADGSCIQTVPGRGYRFADPVTVPVEPVSAAGDAEVIQPASVTPVQTSHGARRWIPAALMAVGVVCLAAILVFGGLWVLPHGPTQRPLAYSAQDRRRSVIVLPFENSSGDPAQDGVAAGITSIVTDHMGRDPSMLHIPAVTAERYRGRSPDLHAIGDELGVHFALVGDARREGGHLLVAAALYDTDDVRPVWSGRFDRPDGPGEQDRIAAAIYDNVWQATIDEEAARALHEHPNKLDKRDLIFAALATPLEQPSKANYLARIALIDRALALDPNDMLALEYSVRIRTYMVVVGYSSNPDADLAIAAKAADQMLLTDANSVLSLHAKAEVLLAQRNWDEAAAVLRRVIVLQPLATNRHFELGYVLMAQGHHKEALESFLTAKQLAAGADPVYSIDKDIALELLANDRFSEAIAQARLAIGEFPPNSGESAEGPWLALIAAESESGQDADARADLQKFLATPRTWGTMTSIEKAPFFAANPKLLEGLRRAGMPHNR